MHKWALFVYAPVHAQVMLMDVVCAQPVRAWSWLLSAPVHTQVGCLCMYKWCWFRP